MRAHLVVEHFLVEYLEASNPNLPSLKDAGLTFNQKIKLLPDAAGAIRFAIPGIRRLNKIRNRIAHNLSLELSNEDKSAFLGVEIFAAMRKEKKKRGMFVGDDPIDVIEDFSKLAAAWLQSGSNGTSEKMGRAMMRASDTTNES